MLQTKTNFAKPHFPNSEFTLFREENPSLFSFFVVFFTLKAGFIQISNVRATVTIKDLSPTNT